MSNIQRKSIKFKANIAFKAIAFKVIADNTGRCKVVQGDSKQFKAMQSGFKTKSSVRAERS